MENMETSTEAMDDVDSILLIQKRYHTNQHPIVSTLLDKGHEVNFLALERGQSEEYSRLEPDLIQFSPIFLFFHSLFTQFVFDIDRHRVGIPAILWYYRYLQKTDPDIITVKRYFAISFATILYAKILGINIAFYDQEPLYDDDSFYIKRRLAVGLYYILHGERFVRYTPVLGDPNERLAIPRSYYIPFVAPSTGESDEQHHFPDGNINVIMVGKLRVPRKNHLMLLASVTSLVERYDLTLTLVGSLKDPTDSYYREVLSAINAADIEEQVEIKQNLSYPAVQDEYKNHDVYVLPSKSEPAAVSHLEAMSQGLPVICSETNGTSCYVDEGENGFLIDPTDQSDLTSTLERLVSSRETIRLFGRTSRNLARTQYSPERFYRLFSWMVRENFE